MRPIFLLHFPEDPAGDALRRKYPQSKSADGRQIAQRLSPVPHADSAAQGCWSVRWQTPHSGRSAVGISILQTPPIKATAVSTAADGHAVPLCRAGVPAGKVPRFPAPHCGNSKKAADRGGLPLSAAFSVPIPVREQDIPYYHRRRRLWVSSGFIYKAGLPGAARFPDRSDGFHVSGQIGRTLPVCP